jgi:MFS transporter, MFS domain-containing protein family, molybdate-anion transporter
VQSVFEGAMYTFIFLWTPALSPNSEKIPHGFIFAMFMVASMAGSAVAGHLLDSGKKPESYMQWVFLLASACMLVPVLFHFYPPTSDAILSTEITSAGMLQCLAFCVFEVCVGVFWPSMMRMRAHFLPDELRSTLINCFRIPLNLFVCVVLYNVSDFPLGAMFALCAIFMFVAFGGCRRFAALVTKDDRVSRVGHNGSLEA